MAKLPPVLLFLGQLCRRHARGRWVLIPLFGILELAAHFVTSQRAPDAEDWERLPGFVERLREPGDLVLIAPEWAEPLARGVLGDGVMPIEDVARADVSSYAYALEVATLGADTRESARFEPIATLEAAPFSIRRLKNKNHVPVLYRFVDHVRPQHLGVTEPDATSERACSFTDRTRPSTGGLPGHPAYPRARFRCSGGEAFFVGVTILDDQNYRPRRCIFAHPPRQGGPLRLRFGNVPLGRKITGYAGLPYLIFRDGVGAPVTIRAFVNGRKIGESAHLDEAGFSPFHFELTSASGTGEVRFEISSSESQNRHFCFSAEMR